MQKRYKFTSTTPYGLHDMRVRKIEIEDDKIILNFKDGYVKLEEPYEKVKGNIILEGVDFDFTNISLYSYKIESSKRNGKIYSVKKFLKKYKKISFEIVDELYGYNQVQYSGYLTIPKDSKNEKKIREMVFSIYYTGDIVYDTKEETPLI